MSSPEAPATEAEPTDELRAGLLAAFQAELGDAVVGSHIKPGLGLWVRVTPEAWVAAGDFARKALACTWFDFLSAVDWLPSPFGRYEDADLDLDVPLAERLEAARQAAPVQGVAGGDTRFQILARVVSPTRHHDVLFKVDVPDDTLTVPSWTRLYSGANWHERETWEMFGIRFDGHPDLRHLYLPGGFEGNPLRKDFPLLARVVKPWPGIVDVEPMPGEAPVAAEDEEGEA